MPKSYAPLRTPDEEPRHSRANAAQAAGAGSRSMSAPPLQLRASGSVMQRDEKDDEERKKNPPPGFTLGKGPMGFLDPNLRLNLSPSLFLNANTEQAGLRYKGPGFGLSAGYQYGGDTSLGSSYRGLFLGAEGKGASGQIGWNPGDSSLWAGGSYKGLHLDGTVNPSTGGFGMNFGFGSRLAPTPGMLGNDLYAGWNGLGSIYKGLPGMGNPLDFYKQHEGNIDAVSGAADSLKRTKGFGFGGGLSLGYNPSGGFKPTTGNLFQQDPSGGPGGMAIPPTPEGMFLMLKLQGYF